MRKVYLDLKVKMILQINEGVNLNEVLDDMDYNFEIDDSKGQVVDTEIESYEIIDSK